MSDKQIVAYMKTEKVLNRFADVLGEHEAKGYIASVLIAVQNNKSLMQCDPDSIYTSGLRAASLRLSVDPSTGQAYLVPFKGKCTLIVGYKGLYDMAIRTGKYNYINVDKVYEGEKWIEDRVTGLHSLGGDGKMSDEIIGWFASFQMGTYQKTMYMSIEEIHDHAKQYSRSYESPNGLWKKNPKAMERKTVLRILLTRWGYIAPSDQANMMAADQDDFAEDDVIEAEITEKPKKSAEENIEELGLGPQKKKGEDWQRKHTDAVIKTAPHFGTIESALAFLDESGLTPNATAPTVRKFSALYQGRRDSGDDHKKALQHAKDNI